MPTSSMSLIQRILGGLHSELADDLLFEILPGPHILVPSGVLVYDMLDKLSEIREKLRLALSW